MTLNAASVEWALEFIGNHSDGDLFPRIVELEAIWEKKEEFVKKISGKPLDEIDVKPNRRFIVPKDDISYRQATQLHPQDSIILSAAVFQFGQGIEDRRLDAKVVYSYRFKPTIEEGFYSHKNAWNGFWTSAASKAAKSEHIIYCDIADFYNQIYHHTVENQLIASGFPNQAKRWIVKLLRSTTAGVSRGIPIGPHAAHLIAEATLVPVDNSLATRGLRFQRYADDIIIFCDSKREARTALASVASILDKQQRLMLQKHKTKIYDNSSEFVEYAKKMIEDRPIDAEEGRLIQIISKYSRGNPYIGISYNNIEKEDWKNFSCEIVTKIIEDYLSQDEIDYIRLRWFYRRLAQIGHPGALDVTIRNFDKLGPCLANICTYIASIQSIQPEEWRGIGEKLLNIMDWDEVDSNEFFRLSILSLFSKNSHLNHFTRLAGMFDNSDSFARREILLAAAKNKAADWIREHKESYNYMDPWQQMAFLYCAKNLPRDERSFFIDRCSTDGPYDEVLANWAKKDPRA